MEMETEEEVTTSIDEMVSNLTPLNRERCIFRVPNALRQGNEKFYEPTVLSIGPYHRGKPELASMEEHKIRYLKEFLERNGETSVRRYVQAVMRREKVARKCYAEPIDGFPCDELVKILVLDGLFILELFHRYRERLRGVLPDDAEPIDPVIDSGVQLIALQKDLLLIENQIPFFILQNLFNTIHPVVSTDNGLKHLALSFIYRRVLMKYCSLHVDNKTLCENVYHLLHFAHKVVCSKISVPANSCSSQLTGDYFVYSATKLKEANVRVIKKSSKCIFDIAFEEGELRIPRLMLSDGSEIEIRNFIAFELCHQPPQQRFFCFYTTFMDYLVASENDVNLLTNSGILNNFMIDAKSVDNMLSKLTKNVIITKHYIYKNISKELNEYCDQNWNKWNASLKQKYFNTPWAFISFLAGLLLLALTATQTFYTMRK